VLIGPSVLFLALWRVARRWVRLGRSL